jgi:hypothetical protein
MSHPGAIGRRWIAVPLLVLLSLFPLLPDAAAAATPNGAESPQALVARLNAGAKAGDFGEIAACMMPEDRAEMAVGLLAGAGMMVAFMGMGGEMAGNMAEGMAEAMGGGEMTKEQKAEAEKAKKQAADQVAAMKGRYEGILKKHGLDKKLEGDGMPEPKEGEAPGVAARRLLEGVDEVALLRDLMGFMEQMGKEGEEGAKEAFETPKEVRDYKIEGDRATAKSGDETLEFAKVDGRWYLKAPQKKAGAPGL